MINEIFCNDENLKHIFFERVGLLLVPETKRRNAFYLKCDGNNGNGVMMNLLKETIGKYNGTSASFKKLGTSFGLAMLIKGMININGEMSKNYNGQDLDIY
jgi:phage/plasmid-associated DNA primase